MDRQAERIVVGYDGSASASAAVDWAAAEAHRRQLDLTVLSAADHLGMAPGIYTPVPWPELFREEAQQLAKLGLERAEQAARDTARASSAEASSAEASSAEASSAEASSAEASSAEASSAEASSAEARSLEASGVAVVGQAAAALVKASESAELVVVGTRGHGDLAGALLASTSFAVSAHARCPVVVVRGNSVRADQDHPVLVGIDGSSGAGAALREAAAVAAGSGAELIVATTYRSSSALSGIDAAYYSSEATGAPGFDAAARAGAVALVEAAAATARELHPDLVVRELALEGPPARELSAAATDCGLVVVGSRGRGGFRGLLLGSVSHGLIHSSPCPVLIVPARVGDSAAPATDNTAH